MIIYSEKTKKTYTTVEACAEAEAAYDAKVAEEKRIAEEKEAARKVRVAELDERPLASSFHFFQILEPVDLYAITAFSISLCPRTSTITQ